MVAAVDWQRVGFSARGGFCAIRSEWELRGSFMARLPGALKRRDEQARLLQENLARVRGMGGERQGAEGAAQGAYPSPQPSPARRRRQNYVFDFHNNT